MCVAGTALGLPRSGSGDSGSGAAETRAKSKSLALAGNVGFGGLSALRFGGLGQPRPSWRAARCALARSLADALLLFGAGSRALLRLMLVRRLPCCEEQHTRIRQTQHTHRAKTTSRHHAPYPQRNNRRSGRGTARPRSMSSSTSSTSCAAASIRGRTAADVNRQSMRKDADGPCSGAAKRHGPTKSTAANLRRRTSEPVVTAPPSVVHLADDVTVGANAGEKLGVVRAEVAAKVADDDTSGAEERLRSDAGGGDGEVLGCVALQVGETRRRLAPQPRRRGAP